MTGFDSTFEQVKILVEHFSDNEKMYIAKEYSEARVRTDFIDKFFTALGWDVNHNVQLNPYEQEVSIERSVNVEGRQQKRADYAFLLAPNYRKDDVKFYVEAKKPARNLSNPVDYFQTCRYGWSAGTPLAVLTDFEEFHILDCRTRPDITTILDTKRDYFHYKDYLDKEKFAKIYWLFSREAIANNSIEKYVEQLPKPRGKAVQKGLFKGGYQSIDEAFLQELDGIRDTLAKAFKKKNPHLGSDELTEMTQKTIDRLVFIRFLEDKQIEPDHYISEFGDSKSAWKDFIYASRKLDAKYNGIVFKKSFIDETNFIEPSDVDFSSVCEELSHVNSPYNFDLIPIHILGSIYERFLGKIVIATDKRVRIEEKPEVRKAGGVYYTPQYIVKYIVENTIGKLIDEKTPKEIAKLRFADVSCGSGSFLITVFDKLLEYHKKFYQNNPKEAKSAGCYEVDGKWVLSLKQKQKILTNNIYGVDIDAQAVEVTQLSLYLKLLEDESNATAEETWVMFKEQILPSLSDNIICGNSLIGTDISSGTLFNWEEEKKLKPMNFKDAFPAIMKAGGFDAIVGNPPYLYSAGKDFNDYFTKTYSFSEYQTDFYVYFIEKSLKLLKKKGNLSYIVSDSWLNSTFFKKMRDSLLTKHRLYQIAIFDYQVFHKVALENSIIFIEAYEKPDVIQIIKFYTQNKIEIINTIKTIQALEEGIINPNRSDEVNSLINKIEKNTTELKTVVKINRGLHAYRTDGYGISKYGNGYQTIKDKELESYHAATRIDDTYLPEIKGKNIDRYIYHYSGKYLSYGKWLAEPRTSEYFFNKKIVLRKIIGKKIYGTHIQEPAALDQSLYIIISKNKDDELLKVLLGVLCSSLAAWYIKNKYSIFDTLYPWYTIKQLSTFPIKLKTEKLHVYVDQMLESKKQLAIAKTDNEKEYLEKKCQGLDRQIDELVYELYGLTEEEIKIVEG